MSVHKQTQESLYEYLRDELDPDQRAEVDSHLASCPRCKAEVEELRVAIELIPARSVLPSQQRTAEFWQSFATQVERRARLEDRERKKSRSSLLEIMGSTLTFHPRFAIAGAGTLALVGVAVLGWHLYTRTTPESEPPRIAQPVVDQSSAQLDQYIRKSKMLLVGITNLKRPEQGSVDLSAERRVSRQLLEETRSLRQQPLDGRSVVLVDNLEKVFEELANAQQDAGRGNIELIRSTIRQENLLFKIRMAEAARGSRYMVKTRGESR